MRTPFDAGHWLTLHTAVVLLALLVYSGLSLARRQRRHPSAAIAWVVSLVLLPYVALPVFLLFGNRKTVRASRRRAPHHAPAEAPLTGGQRFQALAVGLG